MAYQTILFDLDGTLTDSGEGIMNCARLAISHLGLPMPPLEVLRSFVGPPLRDSFLKVGVPEERMEEAVEIFRRRYVTVGKYENFPYPGIADLLETLRSRGHRLCVATSKPEIMALDILEHFGLLNYFEYVCGATMDGTRGTKSEVIDFLLRQIGHSDDLVMVGDTQFDVCGAAAFGIPTIGVTWGYGSEEAMRSSGAADIAHTMDELLAVFDQDGVSGKR